MFVETIDGTIKDLQDFRQKLLDAMKNHESTDDAAQQLLLSISKKYDGHTYHSSQSYDRALHDQAENLTTSTTPQGGADPRRGRRCPSGPGRDRHSCACPGGGTARRRDVLLRTRGT